MRRFLSRGCTVTLLALGLMGWLAAQAMPGGIPFDIRAGTATASLKEFATQAHLQLLFDYKAVERLNTPAVKGQLTPTEALKEMLEGSGFTFREINDHTIAITRPGASTSSIGAQENPSGTEAKEEGKTSLSPGFLLAQVAQGQTSGAGSEESQKRTDNTGEAIQEVVVTAQKRAETVNTTPIAVSVLNMSQLEEAGVTGFPDLASNVPDLQVHTVGVDSYFGVTIRGISNQEYTPNANPAVSNYIDGVYVDLPIGLAVEMYDLSRMELLRGPQGTLYGRNSTGGNVNIVTADPDPAFHADADVSYGNYNDVMTHAMVTGSLTDTLSVRAAVMTHRSDGYFDTEGTTAINYGAADDWGARLTGLWAPSDNFKWRLSFDGFISHGTPAASIETGPNQLPLDGLSPYHQPVDPDPEPNNYIGSDSIRSRMDWIAANGLTFTYVMGYQHLRQYYDWSTTGQVGTPDNPAYEQHWALSSSAQTHEVDATYASDKLNNVLGITYFYDSVVEGGYALYPLLNLEDNQSGQYGEGVTKRSWGAFDQATYSISKSLRLTGGVRYSHDYQRQPENSPIYCGPINPGLTVFDTQFLTPTSSGCGVYPVPAGEGTWSKVTWKGGVEYDLTPATLTYASVTTGYKEGGVQPGLPAVFPATYQPETVTNYEAGVKLRLLDYALNVRAAVFYEDYTNIQTFQLVSEENNVSQATTNAGAARIYGTELESEWNVSSADHFTGFFTYLHARYTVFNNAVNPFESSEVIPSLAGNQLPNAPDLSARVQYSHDFRLTNGGMISPQAAAYWQSNSYTNALNTDYYKVGSYSKTDLRLTYTDPTVRWNVAAYVRNIENRTVRTGDYSSGSGIVFSDFAPPRTFGIRVSYTY